VDLTGLPSDLNTCLPPPEHRLLHPSFIRVYKEKRETFIYVLSCPQPFEGIESGLMFCCRLHLLLVPYKNNI
jgi:hypothetical protein